MLALLSAGFLRGGFGFLKSSSADMIKGGGGTLNREIRVGVTHVSYQFETSSPSQIRVFKGTECTW